MTGSVQVGGLRSRRRLFIWLAVGCVAAAGACVFLQGNALKQDRAGARTRAIAYVSQVVEPAFGDEEPTGPITGQIRQDLTARLQTDVFDVDEVVGRVRVWAPSGALLYSTDDVDHAGQTKSDNLDAIKSAAKGDANVTATLTSGPEPRLTIFVPLRISGPPSGVVEIDDDFALIEANAQQPWGTARTVAIGLAALFGVLALLSYVPSRRSSALTSRAFLDEERPEPPPAPSDRELDRMRSKLEKSEHGRKALETELEQLRLQVGSGRDEAQVRIRELEEELNAANNRVKEVTAFTPTSELEARIQDLEAALAEANARTEQVQAKALDLTSNVTHSESMSLRLQTEAEEARRELASVGSRVAQADARTAEAELKAADAETAKAEMKARLDKLEEELRWSQAQQVETQPLLQEASGRLQEVKNRADESLARATKMEERALDAEAAATRLEERLAKAEAKAAEAELRAREAGMHANAESSGTASQIEELMTELAAAKAKGASSSTRVAELERMLEASVTRGEELAERTTELELRLAGSSDATRHALTDAESVAAELATVRAQVAELETTAATVEARAAALESNLKAAETRAAQAEGSVRELSSRLQDSEAQALKGSKRADAGPAAESRIRTLEEALDAAGARARELAQQAEDLREANTAAESRASEAETRAAETEAKATDVAAAVQHSSGEELATALAHAAELEARNSHIEDELEQTQTRLRSAYAEVEAAQAHAVAESSDRHESPDQLPELASLQAEVDRLTGELARSIESAHEAEEKSARMEAELVMMRRAAANGDEPSGGNGNGSYERPAEEPASPNTVPEESSPDEPAAEAWESSEPSLRARLARTAARKKGRSREDGAPWAR